MILDQVAAPLQGPEMPHLGRARFQAQAIGDFSEREPFDIAKLEKDSINGFKPIENRPNLLACLVADRLLLAISFGPGPGYDVGGAAIAVGDFNGDGRPDMVAGGAGGAVSVLMKLGSGTFAAPASVNAGLPTETEVAVGDVTGDGKADDASAGIARIVPAGRLAPGKVNELTIDTARLIDLQAKPLVGELIADIRGKVVSIRAM